MTRNILFATALVVALTGCESIYRITGMSTPPPDTKSPKVWVITKSGCQSPTIIVAPEPLYFYRANGPVTITWHLETTGYSFATPPQSLLPPPGGKGAQNEITCPSASGKNMVCHNKALSSGSWKYMIRITADAGSQCEGSNPPDLDPTIGND